MLSIICQICTDLLLFWQKDFKNQFLPTFGFKSKNA